MPYDVLNELKRKNRKEHKLMDNDVKAMSDILIDGGFNEEEAEYICEWAPEMGEDLDILRAWINDYDMRTVPWDEVEDYESNGYTVMLPPDMGFDDGKYAIMMMG